MTSEAALPNSLDWKVLANGNVEMRIDRGLKRPMMLDFPPQQVSWLVSAALMAAHEAHQVRLQSGAELAASEEELPAVPIQKVGLAQSNIEGYKTLVLEVGDARMGFAVPDGALSDLGRLLLSLGEQES